MIRTMLIDMGNVLVYFCHDRMCAQIGELCGHDGPAVRKLLIDSGLQWDFERGRVTEDAFRTRLGEIVGRDLLHEALRQAGSDIFSLNTEMIPVLDNLKAAGYRLVLLSNVSVAHFEWIREKYDLLHRFDDFVVSFRVGAIKPEPEMYEAAIRIAGCEPSECFYTDDIPAYVEQGRRFGFNAEVFIGAEDLRGHLVRYGVRPAV